MIASAVLCYSAVTAGSGAGGTDIKRVVHTSWWPPANDKFEEAVGIVSRDLVFMTGMMEPQTPLPTFNISRDVKLELEDIRDIAAAGNTSLRSLVDCITNTPPGSGPAAEAALVSSLGGGSEAPSVTVLETKGEDPSFNTSTTCFATVESSGVGGRTVHRRSTSGINTTVVTKGVWAWCVQTRLRPRQRGPRRFLIVFLR